VVTVEVLAGPVIPHRGARVSVAGSDLDVAQVNSSVEHGRDEGMTQHVRVQSGDPQPGVFRELAEPPGSDVAVHPAPNYILAAYMASGT
jgi:hypothetical protein